MSSLSLLSPKIATESTISTARNPFLIRKAPEFASNHEIDPHFHLRRRKTEGAEEKSRERYQQQRTNISQARSSKGAQNNINRSSSIKHFNSPPKQISHRFQQFATRCHRRHQYHHESQLKKEGFEWEGPDVWIHGASELAANHQIDPISIIHSRAKETVGGRNRAGVDGVVRRRGTAAAVEEARWRRIGRWTRRSRLNRSVQLE